MAQAWHTVAVLHVMHPGMAHEMQTGFELVLPGAGQIHEVFGEPGTLGA